MKEELALLKKQHSGASHFCYAFQIGTSNIIYRANDDGEPGNTAGMPIYGQIQSFGLTNVLVVAVRFYGGTKLGAGGLISAYKTTAQMALAESNIIEKTIDVHLLIRFDYKNINKVMRIIKEKRLRIISQNMDEDCEIKVALRKKEATEIASIFAHIFEIQIDWTE